jgi:protein SCO1/2
MANVKRLQKNDIFSHLNYLSEKSEYICIMRKFLFFALATLIFQSCNNSSDRKLPILGEREPVERTVDGKLLIDTIYQTVPPFSYLNQDSIPVTNKDFDNKIYVTDFFFTSCNTICPIMHRNMLNVYTKFKDNPKVKFLSHSIDVKYDLPSRLKTYATKLGITGNQWEFVHGSRDSIFGIAAKSYLVSAFEDSTDPQGLVHQGWFILVDTKKQLRGAYDGTKEDQVKQLMKDMELLLKEEFGDAK